eukprot:CAMPEP_0197046384 /NCGR_PEP_ID=MMETSP1384-20130603/22111_1 /TAXON_ID=29189 /ORGANISM="Ammonia sp." /LENGTH=49 /DNA_ID= /DNA_START= /DNA_END= /DNA_ORIENTATION=
MAGVVGEEEEGGIDGARNQEDDQYFAVKLGLFVNVEGVVCMRDFSEKVR